MQRSLKLCSKTRLEHEIRSNQSLTGQVEVSMQSVWFAAYLCYILPTAVAFALERKG